MQSPSKFQLNSSRN
jgi:hypothetical protein